MHNKTFYDWLDSLTVKKWEPPTKVNDGIFRYLMSESSGLQIESLHSVQAREARLNREAKYKSDMEFAAYCGKNNIKPAFTSDGKII